MAKVHHSAIVTSDVEASLAFWRDGLGLDVLMDETFEGPWPELFGWDSTSLRSVFLGSASEWGDSGIVELVAATGTLREPAAAAGNVEGFLLLSLFADLDEVLERLATLGVGGEPVVAAVGPTRLAVVRDPNGVRVELMDTAAQSNLAAMAGDQQ